MVVTELRARLSDFARGFAKQEDVMMRTSKLLSGSVLALVVATTFASSPAFAYSVVEGYALCRGDIFRYCASTYPNALRTIACLQEQKQKISKPCQAALSSFGY
jgi:hypothetical protein